VTDDVPAGRPLDFRRCDVASVIAGVLLNRIISAWGLVPLGRGLWLTLLNRIVRPAAD
jgi:hypothetical protein